MNIIMLAIIAVCLLFIAFCLTLWAILQESKKK